MKTPTARFLLTGLACLASAQAARAVVYSIDAGTATGAVGDNTGRTWSAATLNHFTVLAGGQNIVSISAVFGAGLPFASGITGGESFTAVLWNDPNGDGNPNDATVITSASGIITIFNDNVTFQTTAITPVGLSVGQSFFAGFYFQNYTNKFPMGVTGPGSLSDSWVSFNQTAPLASLNTLAVADAFGTLQAVTGQPIVSMIRANGVPEPTTMTFAGLVALGLVARRRRA